MRNFFKKFIGDTSHGRLCKDCEHGEMSHHFKIIPRTTEKGSGSHISIRVNCKECDCTQFRWEMTWHFLQNEKPQDTLLDST